MTAVTVITVLLKESKLIEIGDSMLYKTKVRGLSKSTSEVVLLKNFPGVTNLNFLRNNMESIKRNAESLV